MPIRFAAIEVRSALSDRRRLKPFLMHIFRDYKLELTTLDIILCNDEYLLNLNKRFLEHDTLTDIITFPLTGPGEPIEAEIYISQERIVANAIKFNESSTMELHRVIFHGVLHLCGFGDKSKAEKRKMRTLENYYLKAYFS